jgi:rhamnulokinase
MTSPSFAAVDLGAESGRVILGRLKDKRLKIEEVHRFPNGGVRLDGNLHWDVLHLWSEIKAGLSQASVQSGSSLRSIGLDTWGVDFGLLDANDNLIGNPYHYRDGRTNGVMESVFEIISRDEVYALTGIQFMQLNSLYQLFAMVQSDDPALLIAKTFLNMPDLFNFFLTGEKSSEFSIATTTQCYNPVKRAWASDLLTTLEIPDHIFGEIVPPGTVLGQLRVSHASELELAGVSVVASAGHDTASAVAAVPASQSDYIYLSSGTWSLMGVELDEPLISIDSLVANMTNEGGVEGKIRFLKNIVGLWLVQECRRQWALEGKEYSYADLVEMAAAAPAFGSLIDPSDSRFLAPENMPIAIQSYCQDSGQRVPNDKGALLRCVLESLALEYRWVAEQIDQLTDKQHPVIHIIGGGGQNTLLNQFAASASGRRVITGPVEATAIGNILVQAIAMGEISSLSEGREIVRNSFEVNTYEPQDTADWDEAYQRYLNLKEYENTK